MAASSPASPPQLDSELYFRGVCKEPREEDEQMRKLVVVIIALIAIGVALQPAFAGLGISLVLGLGWAVWELHLRDESDE